MSIKTSESTFASPIIELIIKLHNPAYTPMGFANPATTTPASPSTNDAYIIEKAGTVFGRAGCSVGQILYRRSDATWQLENQKIGNFQIISDIDNDVPDYYGQIGYYDAKYYIGRSFTSNRWRQLITSTEIASYATTSALSSYLLISGLNTALDGKYKTLTDPIQSVVPDYKGQLGVFDTVTGSPRYQYYLARSTSASTKWVQIITSTEIANYVSNTSLATTLASYVDKDGLFKTLSDPVQSVTPDYKGQFGVLDTVTGSPRYQYYFCRSTTSATKWQQIVIPDMIADMATQADLDYQRIVREFKSDARIVSNIDDEYYTHESFNVVVGNKVCTVYQYDNTNEPTPGTHPETNNEIGIRLSIYNIANPNNSNIINVASPGDTLHAVSTDSTHPFIGPNILKISDTVIRIMFTGKSGGVKKAFYRDYNLSSETFTASGVCVLNTQSLSNGLEFNESNVLDHYDWLVLQGKLDNPSGGSYTSAMEGIATDFFKYGSDYYLTVFSNRSGEDERTTLVLKTQDGITWTALGACNAQNLSVKSGAEQYILMEGAVYVDSSDDTLYIFNRTHGLQSDDSSQGIQVCEIDLTGDLYTVTSPVKLTGIELSGSKPAVIVNLEGDLILANIDDPEYQEYIYDDSGLSKYFRTSLSFYLVDVATMTATKLIQITNPEGIHTPAMFLNGGAIMVTYTSNKRRFRQYGTPPDGDIQISKIYL